ncbi:MAG: phage portal protein [Oscillospiraceae bacterium]|nr:phage portal protein [Oscillospiraceae bacterium]
MLTDLNFLQTGQQWPPPGEVERLKTYAAHKKLFENKHAKVYKNAFERLARKTGVSYSAVLNYQRLMSLKLADLAVGQPPSISVPDANGAIDTKRQAAVEKYLCDTQLLRKLFTGVIDMSRYGNAVLQQGKRNGHSVVDVSPPCRWFPVVSAQNIHELEYQVLAHTWKSDAKRKEWRLTVEIHKVAEPGKCEVRTYQLQGQEDGWRIGKELTNGDGKTDTGLGFCPVYVLSNVQTSDCVFGLDDYDTIDSLVSELIVRFAQVSRILDVHADPSMQGPSSAQNVNPQTGERTIKPGKFFTRNDDQPPVEYITWDGQLDAAFRQIELQLNQLYSISEMGAAVFGDLSSRTGAVPSGSALRRLMVSPLAKVQRMACSITPVLRQIIADGVTATGTPLLPEEISIKWNDGLPGDEAEEAATMNVRTGGQPTISQHTAIQRLDNKSPDDVETELERMRTEQAARTAPVLSYLTEELPEVDDDGSPTTG